MTSGWRSKTVNKYRIEIQEDLKGVKGFCQFSGLDSETVVISAYKDEEWNINSPMSLPSNFENAVIVHKCMGELINTVETISYITNLIEKEIKS